MNFYNSLVITALVCASISMLPSISKAQTNSVDGWMYDTVVQPLPAPAWMDKVVMICDTPWVDQSRNAVKPWVKILLDADFVPMNMYPDSFCRLWEPSKDEIWPQECHAEVKAMHARGMKVLAGVYPTVGERGPRDLLNAHPEWRSRQENKVPDAPGLGCLISPFGDALIDLLVQRVKEYGIDGYQFDGWYQWTYCCCPGCRERYKKETGLDIPAKADVTKSDYLHYLVWRDHKLLQRFEQLRTAIKAVKPDAVLVQWNNNDCGGSYPSWMPEALNCVADWTNKEWWDSFDCSNMWLIKRLRGSSGDRPAGVQPYMFMRHGFDVQSGVYHGSSCPMEEVRYRMHKVMTLGSIPIIWPGARAGWTDADTMQVAKDYADFLPYIHNTKSLKYALCIDSYTTLQMQKSTRREDTEERITSSRAGAFRALTEEHIPFDVVSEHNLTPDLLSGYKVVILPNNFCMSERIAQLLRKYVENGGGLIASFETSLHDEWGNPRKDFALADLFDASYISSAPATACRIDFTETKHQITDDAIMHGLMGSHGNTTYYGMFARIKPDPGAICPMKCIDAEHEKDDMLKNWTPVVLSSHGKGKVAYFPAAIDAAYYNAGYPYERMLYANAVRWTAGELPAVLVNAPKCVIAGFYIQQDAKYKRTIVHLLNDLNTTTGHGSKEEKQLAIREEVLPISGIRIIFAGEKPSKVYLVPGGKPLHTVKRANGWEVAVPRLDLHTAVVAEYSL